MGRILRAIKRKLLRYCPGCGVLLNGGFRRWEGSQMKETVRALDADASRASPRPPLVTELLILPDGKVLVHNLTAACAELLSDLNPADEQIRSRANRHRERNDQIGRASCRGRG